MLRFGIMAMQLELLVPPGLPPDQAMAYIGGFDNSHLVRKLAETGFPLIELGGDLTLFFPQCYSPAAVARLAALKAELGLSYTVHLPLWSVEPSTPLAPVRQGSAQALIEVIKAILPLDPEAYVMHATGALAAEFYHMRIGEVARLLVLRQFQAGARATLQTVLAETGISSRKLAIETVEFPFELTLELAEQLDTSICLDTGHILAGFSGPVELFDVLERCLPRLGEIHLHDSPWQGPQQMLGYGKDHQALGKGDLDTPRLLDRLVQAGYSGPIIFELGTADAQSSLALIRQLRPACLA